MNVALVYATTFGHTKKVVDKFLSKVDLPIQEIRAPVFSGDIEAFQAFILFCPTYGDEELHPDFEDFLVALSCRNKLYALCELGNYYGYDDLQFGPARIIRPYLENLGWRELCECLSLDSLPSINWPELDQWLPTVKKAIESCEIEIR